VIFSIFPNAFRSFITLAEVLEAKQFFFGHVQFGHSLMYSGYGKIVKVCVISQKMKTCDFF